MSLYGTSIATFISCPSSPGVLHILRNRPKSEDPRRRGDKRSRPLRSPRAEPEVDEFPPERSEDPAERGHRLVGAQDGSALVFSGELGDERREGRIGRSDSESERDQDDEQNAPRRRERHQKKPERDQSDSADGERAVSYTHL